ncbi:MAG TPA: bifunctional phosphoglucose/phosphomannose isomerase [Candidatus Sulfotelmatobacter sp.]|nr:bifunctional phosphoglucose/phosphomannose isomerase [Candidatus Sulfotelmatobacter sp.]
MAANKPELLDSEEAIGKIDTRGMLGVVARLPEMVAEAERFADGVTVAKKGEIDKVVVLGMGGSAIAGDLAADLLYKKCPVPIITNRQYTLPEYVGEKSLIVALSYSGDTEETLSAAREAERRKLPLICVTSGGKLKELAEKGRYPLFLIPTGYQPRAALPFMLVPLLVALAKLGIIPPVADEIRETGALLQKLVNEYGLARPARNNPVKQAAKKMLGKVPVLFGSVGTTGGAATRLKTQLNENSKMTALVGLFPELDHNEIVNLAELKREAHNFSLLVLRDEEDNERVKKRIEITKSLVTRQVGGVSEIVSQGKNKLARLFSLIIYGDFLSVYLALLQGIDPTPVEVITRLKREMSR